MAKCLLREHVHRLLGEARIERSVAAALLWHHRRARCTKREPPGEAAGGADLVSFPDGRPLAERPEPTAEEIAAEMALLGRLPAAERAPVLEVLADEGHYGSLGLVETMLAEARRGFLEDPVDARSWALSALTVFWQLETPARERRRAATAYVRAHACHGNALRILGALGAAERELEHAFEIAGHEALRESPLLVAELESFLGSLRRDQRRFAEAIAMLEGSAERYASAGEALKAARVKVQISGVLFTSGDPAGALSGLRRAEAQMPQPVPDECRLILRHNEAYYLTELERFAEAEEVVAASETLYRDAGPIIRLGRREWVLARIDAGRGRPQTARRRYRAAYDALVAHRLPYEAALVALELSRVDLDLGRLADARALAEEALPAFERLGVHREALAALALWRRAIERQELTRHLLRRLGRYVRLAAGDPGYRFEP